MAMHLYYASMSSAVRVYWALEELGVPFEKHRLDLKAGDQKKPDFLAINPNGKVPALVDGDAKLFESLAIFIWLGEKHGVEKGMWPKVGTPDHADALAWTTWSSTELMTSLFQRILHATETPMALAKEHRSEGVAKMANERLTACLHVLEKRLEGREYVMGKTFTLVDVANASVVNFGTMMAGVDLAAFKNVAAWAARCGQRPAMGRAGAA